MAVGVVVIRGQPRMAQRPKYQHIRHQIGQRMHPVGDQRGAGQRQARPILATDKTMFTPAPTSVTRVLAWSLVMCPGPSLRLCSLPSPCATRKPRRRV